MRLTEEYIERHKLDILALPHTHDMVCTIFKPSKLDFHLLVVSKWHHPSYAPSKYKVSDLTVNNSALIESPFLINSESISMERTVYMTDIHSFVYWNNFEQFMKDWNTFTKGVSVAATYKEFVLDLWRMFVILNSDGLLLSLQDKNFCDSLDYNIEIKERYECYLNVKNDISFSLRNKWNDWPYLRHFSPLFHKWAYNEKI